MLARRVRRPRVDVRLVLQAVLALVLSALSAVAGGPNEPDRGIGLLVLLGLVAGAGACAWPGGPWCTVAIGLLSTAVLVAEPAVGWLVLSAVLLYLLHALAGLLAAVPRGAEVDPAVLVRFSLRTGQVAAVSTGPVLLLLTADGLVGPSVGWQVLALAAVALAATAPGWLLARR